MAGVTPFLADPDVTVHVGDALDVLQGLPAGSVDCVITSPPYWGLRDYGTGLWDGGNPDCDHQPPPKTSRKFTNGRGEGKRENYCMECDKRFPATSEETERCPNCGLKMFEAADGYAGTNLTSWTTRDETVKDGGCPKGCGARRVDRQQGLEPTPDQYVQGMVAVFREVRRVLADHGTCWLNLGDSYASTKVGNTNYGESSGLHRDGRGEDGRLATNARMREPMAAMQFTKPLPPGLKPKDLVGVPWRLAFALQADGWWLRSDIIWAKPNPMPESVTDRPTKAHEYVFLLSKRPRYFYDAEALREPHARMWDETNGGSWRHGVGDAQRVAERGAAGTHSGPYPLPNPAGRNARSVWEISTQPYPEAHFATYPEELVRRCLLAGCPEAVCGVCGKPRERLVSVQETTDGRADLGDRERNRGGRNDGYTKPPDGLRTIRDTVGWSDCSHGSYRPGIVLDPFLGSGTTALVARNHNRHCVGVELNPAYANLAARRLQQLSLLAEAPCG